ncbi:hypothetical protein Tco_1093084 [Tanacetum coccineum]|uniref:Uncharacterized protein n=1 Tax=Tanacetum coccineum TaxID=301880 RepID=A0ABQ5IBQ2_9ASTR
MLDKLMYDSWKSRMELYMENCENGYLILESIINGPLVWPMIEENGEMRRKRVLELSAPEKLQYEADVKETNIILQGVPVDVYALRNPVLVLPQICSIDQRYAYLPDEVATVLSQHEVLEQSSSRMEKNLSHASGTSCSVAQNEIHDRYRHLSQSTQYKIIKNSIQQIPAAKLFILTEFSCLRLWSLVVSVVNKGDDPLMQHKMMLFLSTVVTSHFSSMKISCDTSLNLDIGNDSGLERVIIKQLDKSSQNFSMTNYLILAMPSSEQSSVVNNSETEITSDSNIIPYSRVNDTLTIELERYKEQVKVLKKGQNVDLKSMISFQIQVHSFQNPFYLKKAQQLEPKLYDGNVIKNTSVIVIPDSEETLMLVEESRSKMLLKQQDPMMLEKKVNTTPVNYAVLKKVSQDFETRFIPQTELSAEQAF